MQRKTMDTTGPKRPPSWLRSGRGGALPPAFHFISKTMADEMAPVEAVDHEATDRKWTDEDTRALIPWRSVNKSLFTGKRNTSVTGFEVFIKERGLGSLDPKLVKKRWENLVHKYKEFKKPQTGVSTEEGGVTAASWKWYALMDEALGARPSVTPPVLFASSSRKVAGTPPPRCGHTPPCGQECKSSFLHSVNPARVSEAREAAEREERRHRETLEREESRHRETVAMEERRFNFLRESEERREREAAAREKETAAERRETAAREERRERETAAERRETAAREERREKETAARMSEAAAREERLLTLLEKISAQK
ncbi:coiled-coil domain-containing protein 177-like [Pseudoliparis swirei]|uniref:coiled-coil domain-containing protein 177-like n=1 Tax=Pseudoliparis swirei TaxID=2059687 RepID=UPI0024BDA451|nr:coiled-coil domain-containing protein 177-like [Pseudoliparis swirei]